jgi:hypothetical protein
MDLYATNNGDVSGDMYSRGGTAQGVAGGVVDDTVVERRTGVSSVVIVYRKRASLAPVTGDRSEGN